MQRKAIERCAERLGVLALLSEALVAFAFCGKRGSLNHSGDRYFLDSALLPPINRITKQAPKACFTMQYSFFLEELGYPLMNIQILIHLDAERDDICASNTNIYTPRYGTML
jgi:hypothetical protein